MEKVQDYFDLKAQKLEKNYKEIKLKNKKDEEYIKNCFHGITDRQLSFFFNIYCKKLNRAILEPG